MATVAGQHVRVLPCEIDHESTRLCGYAILIIGTILILICLYTILISKLVPRTGDLVLDAVMEDTYYCILVPLTVPVTFIAVYWNWVSMKFFRHN